MTQFPMTKQEAKYHLSMAGEFFVAAELQRRGFSAAVTYGNAKRADVVASSRSGDKALVIEVKTTSQPQWVVGGRLPDASPSRAKPWVFVYLPIDPKESPSYYIILQSELRKALTPEDVRSDGASGGSHDVALHRGASHIEVSTLRCRTHNPYEQLVVG